jgi:hypothetical protein
LQPFRNLNLTILRNIADKILQPFRNLNSKILRNIANKILQPFRHLNLKILRNTANKISQLFRNLNLKILKSIYNTTFLPLKDTNRIIPSDMQKLIKLLLKHIDKTNNFPQIHLQYYFSITLSLISVETLLQVSLLNLDVLFVAT